MTEGPQFAPGGVVQGIQPGTDPDSLLAEAEQHILMAEAVAKPGHPIHLPHTYLLRADIALTKARMAMLRQERAQRQETT